MDIELTFINNSNDMNNSEIVIFQKNVATNFDETAVAWKVIKNCGRNWSHKFIYPMTNQIALADSYGNRSNLQDILPGQKWNAKQSNSGNTLTLDSQPASTQEELEIQNNLNSGSVDAQVFKDGKLLVSKRALAPGQKAVFEIEPKIFIGVVSQIEEGQSMNSAVLSEINHEINLFGITKANIIMTGGGTGIDSKPFQFSLDTIS